MKTDQIKNALDIINKLDINQTSLLLAQLSLNFCSLFEEETEDDTRARELLRISDDLDDLAIRIDDLGV